MDQLDYHNENEDEEDDFLGNEIAIVGMACRVPGATNVDQFWGNVRDGVESIRRYGDDELRDAGVSDKLLNHPNYVKAGAPLEGMELFDPRFFKLRPREAQVMDPQHRHFLECSWEALEHAGYDPYRFDGMVGVFGGSGHNIYFPYNVLTNQSLVDSEGYFLLRHTGNDKDFLTTRVSYSFNLKGPSVNVQTACSTSLVAIHMAAQSLNQGECDMALAGGVTIELPHRQGYVHQENEILSPDGHCRAFSADSEGTVFGSGVGVVVLRRLKDAIADNDSILGVILGSAINNDGTDKASYLAPSAEGQSLAISEALQIADIEADTITYVEAHGTGTKLGDPIEIQGLTQAFRHTTAERQYCALGSVKTNIGHLDTAAGVVSVIKTVQALRHKQLPPSLNFDQPNPLIDFAHSPFYVNTTLQDWSEPEDFPRRAGVSSLGVGGTNAHLIVQEGMARPLSDPPARRYQLLTLSAVTSTALDGNGVRMADFLRENEAVNLADVAYTTQIGRRAFAQRRVVVGGSQSEMVTALNKKDRTHVASGAAAESPPEKIFLFPGGGAQYPQMGIDLYRTEPLYKETIDHCFQLLKSQLDVDLRALMFPAPEDEEAAAQQLQRPSLSLPAIFMTEYGLAQMWRSWGIEPQAMLGHSMGEYTAACLAGVLSLKDALSIVTLRGQLFETLPEGGMISVGMLEEELRPLLVEGCSIAVINNREICVVSGEVAAIEAMEVKLAELAISCQRIKIKVAAHSPMLEPILADFEAHMETVTFHPPRIPYISNVTGDWIKPEEAMSPAYWVRHLRHTVRFADGLSKLLTDVPKLFLEVGPGQVLSGLVRSHGQKQHQHIAVTSMRHFRETTPDDQHLLLALGKIWASGIDIDWSLFYGNEVRHRLHLPTYAFDHAPYWIEPGKTLFTAEPAARDHFAKQENVADWFSQFEWRNDRAPVVVPRYLEQGNWLILTDELGIGEFLKAKLIGRMQTVITVSLGDRYQQLNRQNFVVRAHRQDDYDQLIQSLVEQEMMPRHIVHMWTVYRPEIKTSTIQAYQHAQTQGFGSLLYLIQSLGKIEYDEPLTLNILTNGSQQIGREKLSNPEKAVLMGPCRVIPREYPNIKTRLIDVLVPSDARQSWLFRPDDEEEYEPLQAIAEQILPELLSDKSDMILAYRDTGRWILEACPLALDQMPAIEPLLKQYGVYLITGGLGGIGLTLATHLAKTYEARLVLVGRTTLPPRREWRGWLRKHAPTHQTSRIIQQIKQLEELGGQVIYLSADVTQEREIKSAVADAIRQFHRIDGVIHAAGVIDDDLIQVKDMVRAERVLAPKVLGTLNLHKALRRTPLDFMVLFSSTSTVLAPMGQVDYVAANSFLNTFATKQSGRGHGLVVALNWGIWRDVGMAAAAVRGEGERLHGREMAHPLLGHFMVESPQKLEYVVDYRVDGYWLLSQHRIKQGAALIPGTGYLELASAALAQENLRAAVSIRDLFFLSPLTVQDDETKRVHITLESQSFGEDYLFVVTSESGKAIKEHARGLVRSLRESAPASVSLPAIKARCQGDHISYGPLEQETKQELYLDFGLRWKNLREVFLGDGESLAHLVLPAQYQEDTETFMLHPALLDLATTHGLPLLEGYEEDDGLYVPFSYHSLKAYAPLAARIYSHCRLRLPANREMPSFDVTLTDERGDVLVEIEGFTMKRVAHTEMISLQSRVEENEPTTYLEKTIEAGITPAEGVEAFTAVLSHAVPPQIIVSSINLDTLQDSMTAQVETIVSGMGMNSERPGHLTTTYAEPTNDVERALVDYWENLIGVKPVGIDDDFFDLGGHSLIAVRFFTRVKKQYHIDLSLATLFETPTIAQCAKRIMHELGMENEVESAVRQETQRKIWSPLVTLNGLVPGRTPFFCVHGAGGNVFNFKSLARHIGEDQPFYALQAQGVDGILPPLRSVELMAELYLAEIQRVRPSGPYRLGGYSGGGVVAYEIAQRLVADGEQVDVVALLDTFHPAIESQRISLGEHWRQLTARGLGYVRERLSKREARASNQQLAEESLAYVAQHPGEVIPIVHLEHYLVDTFLRAMKTYEPRPYSGRVVQYSASDTWIMYKHAGADRGWLDLVPHLEMHTTPGDHDNLFEEPNVQVLANLLRGLLSE